MQQLMLDDVLVTRRSLPLWLLELNADTEFLHARAPLASCALIRAILPPLLDIRARLELDPERGKARLRGLTRRLNQTLAPYHWKDETSYPDPATVDQPLLSVVYWQFQLPADLPPLDRHQATELWWHLDQTAKDTNDRGWLAAIRRDADTEITGVSSRRQATGQRSLLLFQRVKPRLPSWETAILTAEVLDNHLSGRARCLLPVSVLARVSEQANLPLSELLGEPWRRDEALYTFASTIEAIYLKAPKELHALVQAAAPIELTLRILARHSPNISDHLDNMASAIGSLRAAN